MSRRLLALLVILLQAGLLVGCTSGTAAPPSLPSAPAAAGSLTELPVPPPYQLTGKPVLGPDQSCWFAAIAQHNFGSEQPSGALVRLALDGTFRLFPLPTAQSYPTGLAMVPDDTLWFTAVQGTGPLSGQGVDSPPYFQSTAAVIGTMTRTGQFTMFPLPPARVSLVGIAAGPDGNVWFTEVITPQITAPSGHIGRITPAGVVTTFAVPHWHQADWIGPIIAGPDGNVWFAINRISDDVVDINSKQLAEIGRITPQGAITVFPLGEIFVSDITLGPDHGIWFIGTQRGVPRATVGRLTADGQVRTWISPQDAYARSLTTGTDGVLWFPTRDGVVGRVTTAGVFTFYSVGGFLARDVPSIAQRGGMVSNSDGTFWLADIDRIGKFRIQESP